MRVITGSARGMALRAPKGMDTRPTMDQVKEGIFSAKMCIRDRAWTAQSGVAA